MTKPRHMTVLVPTELENIIRERCRANRRNLSQEMLFLIETGLGVVSEEVRNAIHLFYKMNGAEDPIPPDTVPRV